MFVGADGDAVIDETDVPADAFSVTTTAPGASGVAALHVPVGPAPAATVVVKPAKPNVKFVPAVTPVPPTLQMPSVPVIPVDTRARVKVRAPCCPCASWLVADRPA